MYRFNTSEFICKLSQYNLTKNWGIEPTLTSIFIGYHSVSTDEDFDLLRLPVYVKEFSLMNSSELILKVSERLDNYNTYEKITHILRKENKDAYIWFLLDTKDKPIRVNVEYSHDKLLVLRESNNSTSVFQFNHLDLVKGERESIFFKGIGYILIFCSCWALCWIVRMNREITKYTAFNRIPETENLYPNLYFYLIYNFSSLYIETISSN